MNIDKPTLLKICEWLGGVPNWTDKDDPEMNEIKTWLITKQARGMIQDRLCDDDWEISVFRGLDWDGNNYYWVTLERGDEMTKQFKNQCHNMAWLLAAAWWVDERKK